MSSSIKKTHVFREKSWEPIVEIDGEALVYQMPVACGHFDKSFRFRLDPAEFEILKADEERRYFLYALLHSQYQSKQMTASILTDESFQKVLLDDKNAVEELLSTQDEASNRAVSNLVRILMKRDQQPMIAGIWFAER
jgi:hypothetical protein